MKKFIFLLIIVAIIVLIFIFMNNKENTNLESNTAEISMGELQITPIQHASVMLSWADKIIYVDPAEGSYDGRPLADIILLTDIHGDHLKPEILSQVITDQTVIVAPQAVAEKLPSELKVNLKVLANGETTEEIGFHIEAIPMYNLPESESAFHTKGRGNGYVVERDAKRVYFAGDTADIPEMRSLQNIDIAFVPMNLPYTMTVESAADAVLEFKPKQVYPYHYRGTEGLSDVVKFKQIVNEGDSNIEVVQSEWYPSF